MEIISEKDKPLMARKQVCVEITFDGPTPSRKKVRKQIADKFKTKEELVFVHQIDTEFGFRRANVTANIYKKKEDIKEPSYIHERHKKEVKEPEKKESKPKKQEKPAEEKDQKQEQKKEKKTEEKSKPKKQEDEKPKKDTPDKKSEKHKDVKKDD
ncbi:MAG: 30S ribosomal protein S24e [Candidatus Woesearchaeota archaeon]|nr:30S ribosomal protein S24e [Candidatus Woesearchaeota archaeon]